MTHSTPLHNRSTEHKAEILRKTLAATRLHRAPLSHAERRYYQPKMNNDPPALLKSLRLETFPHKSSVGLCPPIPVLVRHKADTVGGVIEGDHHSKNTNPGFSRNILGGFFTS
ncbi:hypothetical protein Pmar_PMAR027599 [Perkinsus marinus ATCC 50983]|uniref:Uncharacterized protein n=1 Tax=Perkinsus marinus (strain ATCC 50983 / TXsc) TaxID=423536 RepID=C5KC71_PERM5|nr:hypothetical protein Pmar_PMAR027599 [Perkinsus marinus ATCC 50983]EER17884.1 hypothetical protein Pmar_PMAR027599 [Perkinsus marinus ATCC 50983]|eukprot:XP_002786088.1 hypothetical protein Pmar_PMAR027599 [Perkinsus marinus ATCC 50983]